MYKDVKDVEVEGEGESEEISRSLSKGSRGSSGLSIFRKSRSASRSVHDRVGRSGRSGGADIETVDKTKKHRAESSIFRLVAYSKPETPYFIVGGIAALANGTTFPIFGLLLSNLIATYYQPDKAKLRRDANFWSLMYLVLACGIFIVAPTQFYTFAVIGHRLIRRLRRLTFDKVLRNEVAWFDEDDNGR